MPDANEQIREARDRMKEELGEIRDQKKQIELRDGELSRITNALKDREDKLLEAENRLVVRTQEVKQLAESSAQLKLKLEEKMSTNERVCAHHEGARSESRPRIPCAKWPQRCYT